MTRLLRRPAVLEIVGCSASTLRRIPDFPRPIRISLHSVGWIEDEVRQWIEKRSAARVERAAP